jgi:CrcB protein
MSAVSFAYVAVGGAFGAMCRHFVQTLLTREYPMVFPLGTFCVNIIGSFLLGLWVASVVYLIPEKSAKDLHLLFAIGALGGFTTFSTFAIDAFMLLEKGMTAQLAGYVIGSVLLSILAVFAGMSLVKYIYG